MEVNRDIILFVKTAISLQGEARTQLFIAYIFPINSEVDNWRSVEILMRTSVITWFYNELAHQCQS